LDPEFEVVAVVFVIRVHNCASESFLHTETRLKGDGRDRGTKGLQCPTLYDELQTSLVGFKRALLLSRNSDDRQIKNPLIGQWSTHHVMSHTKSLCKEPP
jgi:hypothetical protein